MNEREIVLEALLQYYKGNEYAAKVLSDVLYKYAYYEKQERSFINRLFEGVIERQITLDFIINSFSTVKVNKQKPVIRAILRMAVYQIFYMDSVPDFAAINEAAKLAKRKKFNTLTGFVNGVLRSISKEKDSIKFPEKSQNLVKYLSVIYSCPEWLCEHYISEVGDKAEDVIKASVGKSHIYGRVNLSLIDREQLLTRLNNEGIEACVVDGFDAAIEIVKMDSLDSSDSFNEGLFVIQDLSSQMVVGGINLDSNSFVVDVCAAPGGKTLHALDKGAKVLARDVSEGKIEKIYENVEKCGFNGATLEVWDALNEDENLIGKADVVIADLPCSGLGVIGRKSDIKYRVTKEDLSSLAELQKNILNVVSKYVKKGGTLIFSTCTVNKLENEDNVRYIEENLPFEKAYEVKKMVQGIDGTDGFFISRFIKK